VLSTVGCAGGLLRPEYISAAFTIDRQLIDVTTNALSISLTMFWVVGFQIVSTNYFMSIGKAGKSIFLSLTRQVIFLIPFLLLLPGMLGLNGVWWSFPASDILATLVTAMMIYHQLRRSAPKQSVSAGGA
ncbi:MAG: MATE family efflux transporter, partial [Muribaculaceae bacterium]|nr:MATE family efflux transporter [Muribaculaceae bacterium]